MAIALAQEDTQPVDQVVAEAPIGGLAADAVISQVAPTVESFKISPEHVI